LILNSRLEGFGQSELELVANVARYHRGAEPKKKHANFGQLSERDQQRVRQLAAILRLAGGLDRSNTQQVQNVTAEHVDGRTTLLVQSDADPEVDLWGARRRSAMFEEVFDTKLEIRWQAAPSDEPRINGRKQNTEREARGA
jgi:exopolyphosphatase/guanosine-5'-triphosphate,3'-diphosphate pyrophosphatase